MPLERLTSRHYGRGTVTQLNARVDGGWNKYTTSGVMESNTGMNLYPSDVFLKPISLQKSHPLGPTDYMSVFDL